MKLDNTKFITITDIENELKEVQKELDNDTPMNPLSYARYKELIKYKEELLNKKNELETKIENFFNNLKEKEEIVKTDNYLNWLVSFTEQFNQWSDDTFINEEELITEVDSKFISLLSTFQSYIESLAIHQNIFSISDDYYDFYIFKLKNNYYKIYTICGQGAFTTIEKLKEIPISYVKVDEELTEEDLKNRELIQYIIINKDLLDKVSSAKFGVHIGHACTIAAINECNTEKFKRWYKDGQLQKKIILTAPSKKLEELEKEFYSVRDLGFTEVEDNTLLAVSLGIMTREEAKPYIKRLQLWK